MKLTSIGGISATINLFFGFINVYNAADPFWTTLGAICLVLGGVIIGMSIMERFIRT